MGFVRDRKDSLYDILCVLWSYKDNFSKLFEEDKLKVSKLTSLFLVLSRPPFQKSWYGTFSVSMQSGVNPPVGLLEDLTFLNDKGIISLNDRCITLNTFLDAEKSADSYFREWYDILKSVYRRLF